jgi:hypothetical protein
MIIARVAEAPGDFEEPSRYLLPSHRTSGKGHE